MRVERIHPPRRDERRPWGPRVALSPLRGQLVLVELGRDQAALLLDGPDVHSLLLAGHHALLPGPAGAPAPPLPPDQRDALGGGAQPARRLRRVDERLDLLPLRAGAGPWLELPGGGRARLAIADPLQFHASFLRHSGDLDATGFEAIAARATASALERAALALGEGAGAGPLARRANTALSGVGLHLACARLPQPVGETVVA